MLKGKILGGLCAVALLVVGTAQAQENATLTLKSGEKITGQLVDLGGVGFTVRVNGTDRQIPESNVAVIDFTGGTMSDADWQRFTGPQVVLRNGQTIDGSLYDIGGTTPLKLTVRTNTGERELSSTEVARVVLSRPETVATATSGQSGVAAPAGGTTITVNGNQPWTPTGITVRKGDRLSLSSTGEVQLSADTNDVATPDGARSGRYAARARMPRTIAGALIGRIGPNGQPFGIGTQTLIPAPGAGQLFLGVNDDVFTDNQGSFQVTIANLGGGR
jgi:hypothetical protein